MSDDKATASGNFEQDIARGVAMIGEALPEVTAKPDDDGAEEIMAAQDAYPSGLLGAVLAIVREEPLRALVWAAGIGMAVGLLTSK